MSTNRHNQDRYDVIQAQAEFDSMHLPLNVQQIVADLTAKVDRLKEENLKLRAEVDELKNYKFMYEGLQ